MNNIVRYDCGCIGFEPDDKGSAVLLQACDSDDGYPVSGRNMIGKAYKQLSDEGGRYYQMQVYNAFVAMHQLAVLRQALKPIIKE